MSGLLFKTVSSSVRESSPQNTLRLYVRIALFQMRVTIQWTGFNTGLDHWTTL